MTRDGPVGVALLAIAVGAVIGAWMRWALALWLNPRLEALPLGTLAANLIGGYLIGVAIGVFAGHPAVAPHWRLMIITGFLGGLTTFSAFSAESVTLMQNGQWHAALVHILVHVVGSLAATGVGIASVRALST